MIICLYCGYQSKRGNHHWEKCIYYKKPQLFVDHLEIAKNIYNKAAKDLGPDLNGGSLTDLIADNTDWPLEEIKSVIACLGTNITQHFK